jgi:hypothetical protein
MSKDEPFRWWLGMPLTSSRIVNMHPEGVDPDANTLTLDKLYEAARTLPKPHPLSGLTVVYYADNMRDAALAFVEEYNKQLALGTSVIAVRSDYLPPGYIMGRRGTGRFAPVAGAGDIDADVVLIAGPGPAAKDEPTNP